MPWSKDAEAGVLGAILQDGSRFEGVRERLSEGAFYRDGNRLIFAAITRLVERGEAVDPVLLVDELEGRGEFQKAGGTEYLAWLGSVPVLNLDSYAERVRELAQRRELIEAAREIGQAATDAEPGSWEELVDGASRRIDKLAATSDRGGYELAADLVMPALDELARARENPSGLVGLSTGFSDLDAMTGGLKPGELWVVAGRPSMGKTSLALDFARHVALGSGEAVGFFSLEMPKLALVERLICTEARVPLYRARRRDLSDDEHERLAYAAGSVKQARIAVDDTSDLTTLELRSRARRMRKREGVAVLIVDYMQLMRVPGEKATREQEVAEVSRTLKVLAKDLEVPVIGLSQLNRAAEHRQNKRPVLADLRESGAIEQDADLVLFPFRPSMYANGKDRVDASASELIVAKHRNGAVGRVRTYWRGELMSFESAALGKRETAA
jgi:replicative DNA helicase